MCLFSWNWMVHQVRFYSSANRLDLFVPLSTKVNRFFFCFSRSAFFTLSLSPVSDLDFKFFRDNIKEKLNRFFLYARRWHRCENKCMHNNTHDCSKHQVLLILNLYITWKRNKISRNNTTEYIKIQYEYSIQLGHIFLYIKINKKIQIFQTYFKYTKRHFMFQIFYK